MPSQKLGTSASRDPVLAVVASAADKAIAGARNSSYPKQVAYFMASFIAVISLCHIFSMLYQFITRQRVYGWNRRTAPSLRRVPTAAVDFLRTLALRWTIPVGSSHELNLAEVGLTLGYMAVLFSWTFVNSMLHLSLSR